MKVSFFLSRPKAESETAIYARICYSGYKFKYYTPESINPKFWNKETRRAKETQKFREFPEFNARLNNIEANIKSIHRRYINDHESANPTPEILKKELDKEIKFKTLTPANNYGLVFFLKSIIEQSEKQIRLHHKTGNPISKNTLKTYKTTLHHIQKFEAIKRKEIVFANVDLDFYSDYTEYLMKSAKLAANTIGKHIQIIKLLMNEATERGINTNLSYKSKRFVTVREKSDNIYLSQSEIEDIERLDLSGNNRLEKVRDLFLIGCYTGLRYSDYSILQPHQIKNGYIETVQVKTGDSVIIPVHTAVQKIIEKYDYKLPSAISNQKTNDYLKEIGKQVPSLKETFAKTFTKGGIKLNTNIEKWELLSTHTARRSFATNEFLAGTPAITIMAITGHRTEKAFLRYIKLTPNEHAKLLKMHWEKRSDLKVI